MANFAKLDIVFTGSSLIDDLLSFGSINLSLIISETAKTLRQGPNEFTSGIDASTTAQRYYDALVADYGQYFNITLSSNTVFVEATDYDVEFSGFSFPSYVTYFYTAPVAPSDFEITGITVQSADTEDRNTHARFNVAIDNGTSPYDITAPVSKLAQTEPLFFDYLRRPPEPLVPVAIVDDNGDVAVVDPLLTVDYFTLDSITVNESISGATVIGNTTTVLGDISTTKEYSLDNIIWQSGASFTGIVAGNYTFYVRDNLGANYSLPFEVVGVSVDKPDPYYEIVNTNPLRHIERISFDCDFIPNWDNALFADILANQFPNVEKKNYYQLISDCDTISTQIRTNYDNITINVIDSEGNIILNPTATLKKENIQQKDKRDCSLKQVNSGEYVGKTFLYFTGGNAYTPDTTTIEGTYTNPSKKVFSFASNGDLFSISNTTINGDYTQLDVIYDTESGYYGVVLDLAYSGDTVQVGIVQTLYNEQVYNIWEYSLVGTALSTGCYRIEILLQDNDVRYDDVYYDTEPIEKISSTKDTVVFDASNSQENTANIDFTTGINLRIRIEGRFIVATNSEENTDFQSQQGKKVLLKSIITRSIPFESDLVPFYIAEKLAILSSLDDLEIQKVKFVKGEEVENENKASERNPFVLITRDYQQDTQISISDNVGITTESSTVIGETDTIVIGI